MQPIKTHTAGKINSGGLPTPYALIGVVEKNPPEKTGTCPKNPYNRSRLGEYDKGKEYVSRRILPPAVRNAGENIKSITFFNLKIKLINKINNQKNCNTELNNKSNAVKNAKSLVNLFSNGVCLSNALAFNPASRVKSSEDRVRSSAFRAFYSVFGVPNPEHGAFYSAHQAQRSEVGVPTSESQAFNSESRVWNSGFRANSTNVKKHYPYVYQYIKQN